MKEQQEYSVRKECSANFEKLLHSKGLQFIKIGVKVWWWDEMVLKYTFICDVWDYGEIQDLQIKYEQEQREIIYKNNRERYAKQTAKDNTALG